MMSDAEWDEIAGDGIDRRIPEDDLHWRECAWEWLQSHTQTGRDPDDAAEEAVSATAPDA